jgi:hypothetical protein
VSVVYCWRKNEWRESGAADKHKICVKIGKSASETLLLLTVVNTLWRNRVLLNRTDGSRNGEKKRPKLWPDKWIFHHDNAPVHDALRVREFLAKKSITKMDHPSYSPDLTPHDFQNWKMPWMDKGHSWHPKQRDNVTARYSGKRFSRLFPAVTPSSHEVHSFKRKVFRRRQQPLVHSKQIFLSQGHSGN